MPLNRDLAEFCIRLRTAPDEICFTLPGGAQACIELDAKAPDVAELAKKGFAQLNAALTPLKPLFDIIDVIVALKDCIQAIPDSIGPPPSPTPIIECLQNLLAKVQALLRLLPQYSIPLLIAEVLDVLIMFLEGYKAQMQAQLRALQRIVEAGTRATELGNVDFQLLLDCAEGNMGVEAANLNASVKPLNRLLGTINFFADLAGLPCIPSVPDLSELNQSSIDQIDQIIEILMRIRRLIPVPTIDMSKPSATSKPCE